MSDRSFTSRCITTVVCCPWGRRAASASQPASTRRMNAVAGVRQRGPLIRPSVAVVVIVFPLGDQRITMRLQGRVELRGVQMRQV